jgi:citrate lyase subunit beta/citryl-CoA lyase
MDRLPRPRRSLLYVPASNDRALSRARELPVDGLLIDLEDGVAPSAKQAARAAALAAIAGGFGPREVLLRVNGTGTPWQAEDLAAAARAGADGVLLPKVERAEEVEAAVVALEAAGAPTGLALWVMIETPRAVLRAAEIAAAHPRLAGLVAGTSDLVKDLHARHTPERTEVLTSLSLIVLAARAEGLAALDGVHLDLDDEAGFEQACAQGRALGFDGKTLVHPRQVAAANRAFAPTPEDVAWSRRVIDAHARALSMGSGVVVLEGRLIEALHVENARRIAALAEAIAARDSRA